MVDYSELRKKFPPRNPARVNSAAVKKAIAREYARRKAELGAGAPSMKKGLLFYAVAAAGLTVAGTLVLSAAGRGGPAHVSRAQVLARKSIDALAVALGRYRYHTGTYPSTEEGLARLASSAVALPGWNGPYVRRIVDDPWGSPYVYARNGDSENPTLYSRGPDRVAGTTDDVLPDPALFDEPFRDTSWTVEWLPRGLRGYVVAPDEETKKALERQISSIREARAAADAAARGPKPRRPPPRAEFAPDGTFVPGPDPWGERPDEVRILTDWSREGSEGLPVEVKCATSGDEIELFLDGVSQGRRSGAPWSVLSWSVPFETGELKAIAFRGGMAIGEDSVKTAGEAAALRLRADVPSAGDGEVAYVRIDAVDEGGTPLPRAPLSVRLSAEGPGALESAAGGALEQPVDLSGGPAVVAVVRDTGGSGLPVRISASAGGVRGASIAVPR